MVTRADLAHDGLGAFHLVNRRETSLRKSPLYDGLQSIYLHMHDEGFVKAGIKHLEDLMWKKLKSRYENLPKNLDDNGLKAGFKDYYSGKFDQQTAYANDHTRKATLQNAKPLLASRQNKNNYRGLLTELLEAVEHAHGFGPISYAWGTSAESFLANLRARRPFKDYGAAGNHGDNTHRVQWFIICTRLFLGVADAAKFYEATAYWTCDLVDHPGGKRTLYLWDFLCDNADNTTGWNKVEAKGLNPVYVMDLLLSDDYPLLQAFVSYRQRKDVVSNVKSGNAIPDEDRASYTSDGVMLKALDRAALRFKRKPLISLSDKDKHELATLLGKRGFTDT